MAQLVFEATVQIAQPASGVVKTISGRGSTATIATNYLIKKVVGMVGTIVPGSARVKQQLTPTEIGTNYPLHADSLFEDATLFLHRLSNGVVIDNAQVNIKNMSLAYAGVVPGEVNLGDADIQAIGTTHADSAGNTGFVVYAGQFVD